MKFAVNVEYPHEYREGYTLRFDTLDAAKEYGESVAKGKFGQGGYTRVMIYALVEELN